MTTTPEDATWDGPAFRNDTHKINGLSCVQLNDLIALGKCDATSDQDEGLEI